MCLVVKAVSAMDEITTVAPVWYSFTMYVQSSFVLGELIAQHYST